MLWKDEYKIGVSLIDNQHKAMFDRVDLLLATLSKNNNDYTRTECINTIGYLKQYCVIHFRDEEIFQKSIQYAGLTIHKKEHDDFLNGILEYEQDFLSQDYSVSLIRDFISSLLSWLIFHVRGSDRNMISGALPAIYSETDTFVDLFLHSVDEIFDKLFFTHAIAEKQSLFKSNLSGDVFATLHFVGNLDAYVVIGMKYNMAIQLLCFITNMEITNIDETVFITVEKLATLIGHTTAIKLSTTTNSCSIKKTIVTMHTFNKTITDFHTGELVHMHTSYGNFDVLIKENKMT